MKKQFYVSPELLIYGLKTQSLICQSGAQNRTEDLFVNGTIHSEDEDGWSY